MNPNHLKELIEMWHRVAVKKHNGYWKVFLFINWNDLFEWTVERKDISLCLCAWLWGFYCNEDEIKTKFTNEYKIVTPAPKLLQPWDKCVILENVREVAEKDWRGTCAMQSIWNTVFVVDSTWPWFYNLLEYQNWDVIWDMGAIPHRAVAPYYGEDTISPKEWEEITVEIDGKKVKAKILSVEQS